MCNFLYNDNPFIGGKRQQSSPIGETMCPFSTFYPEFAAFTQRQPRSSARVSPALGAPSLEGESVYSVFLHRVEHVHTDG